MSETTSRPAPNAFECFHARVLVGVYTAVSGLLLLPWGVLTIAVVILDAFRGGFRLWQHYCTEQVAEQHALLAREGADHDVHGDHGPT